MAAIENESDGLFMLWKPLFISLLASRSSICQDKVLAEHGAILHE
jgi:hypothetical protein